MSDNNIQRSLGRIEGALKAINIRLEKIEKMPITCNKRFNILETYKDKQYGVILTMGAIAGAIASWIIEFFIKTK